MIFYDLTTSSQWGGRSVGIVRVERELYNGLLSILGGTQVVPVVYHHPTRLFYKLRSDIVSLIASGLATVDFNFELPADIQQGISSCFDSPSQDYVAAHQLDLTEAWAVVRLASQAPSYQEEWMTQPVIDGFGEKKWWIPFLSAVDGVLSPGPEDVIFTAGLDWDHKDNRAIRLLKRSKGFRYVSFIHDLVPVNYPQFIVPAIRTKISTFFSDLAWVADGYVCSTSAVRKDLETFVQHLTGGSADVVAIPFGTPPQGASDPSAGDDEIAAAGLAGKRYMLYVSTIEPRKNHRTLYLAWRRGIDAGTIDPAQDRLVFLGMPGWLSNDLIEAIAADRSLKGSIVILSGLSDDAVDALYRGCVATVFPSFAEGYGLAIAEAHAHGKWVIASTQPAAPEVAGDGADYVDPDDIPGWLAAMSSALSSPKLLRAKEKILSKKTPTTWKTSASVLVASGVLKARSSK